MRRRLSLFGDSSRIFLLGWKKRAMAEPTAPMPPGRAVLGMVEFLHCRNVGTVAMDSYRSYQDHNPKPRNVGCARNHDGPDRRCAINNSVAPVGDQTKAAEVQLPSTMEHPTPP